MMFLLKNKRLWAFAGGLLASSVLKSDTFHNIAVKATVAGMKAQKSLKSSMQSIKEEAEDICYDEAIINEEE